MTYQRAIEYAQKRGYNVELFPLNKMKGCTILLEEQHYIAISDKLPESERLPVLAHELGHCETGALYTGTDTKQQRIQAENAANQWAASFLLRD